ncbi:MAG: DUF134 domain-containing protein [Candidatus Hodarchaeota archaeon]
MSDPPAWSRGRGHGRRGRHRRMGRPRACPRISFDWNQVEGETILTLAPRELEALRLVDGKGLTQEEAANRMCVSRGTVWRLINRARKEIIRALGSGRIIKIRIHNHEEDEG